MIEFKRTLMAASLPAGAGCHLARRSYEGLSAQLVLWVNNIITLHSRDPFLLCCEQSPLTRQLVIGKDQSRVDVVALAVGVRPLKPNGKRVDVIALLNVLLDPEVLPAIHPRASADD